MRAEGERSAHGLALHGRLRVRHRTRRSEDAYVDWARRFILFHDKCHLSQLGPEAVTALAVETMHG